MPDVFISYSRADIDFVRRLHGALVARGKDVWIDWEDIPPTAEWLAEVFAGIEGSDNFLFVITPSSLASDVCKQELGHAVEQRKRLVPVLHRKPDGAPMPQALGERNWTFLRDEDDFASAFERLVTALETDLDWVSEHTRLLGRALEWEKEGKDASFLLRGRDLEEAERWIASQTAEREPRPTPLQSEYVLASRRGAKRRQRILLSGALVAVVVASGLALFAWSQRNDAVSQRKRAEHQARIARSRELAAESTAALDVDPQRSLVLAARAAETAGTSQAEDALRLALRTSRLRALIRVSAPVHAVAFSPHGAEVAAALDDGSVRLWNPSERRIVATLRLAAAPARAVSFSRDGRLLLGAGDGGAVVWSTARLPLQRLATFDRKGRPFSGALSPDGTLAATGDRDGVVRLWRTSSGELERRLVGPGLRWPIAAVAFSADGSELAAASGLRTFVWRLHGSSAPVSLPDTQEVWAVAFDPGGRYLATGDSEGTARVWDLRKRSGTALSGHEAAISAVGFSPDGATLVTASEDETARLWDVASGRTLAELRGHGGLVLGAAFAPDGMSVATGGTDDTIRIWAATPDPIVRTLVSPNGKPLRDVALNPSGRRIVTASEDLTARIWDVANGRVLRTLRHGAGDDQWVESARFSRDGRLVLTGGDDGTAKIWESASGRLVETIGRRGDAEVYDASFSPGGNLVATAGAGRSVSLWQWRQRQLVRRLDAAADRVNALAFSPGGATVAAATENAVRVWRVADGAPTAAFVGPLGAGGHDRFTSVAFSPDGALLAAGGSSGAAWLWSVRSRELVARIDAHGEVVAHVGFSADGRFLVTVGHDGLVKVWTVPDGHVVTIVQTRSRSLESVVFGGRTPLIAAAGDGGRVTLLRCEECRPLRSLVCLAARRVEPLVRARERDAFDRCR